ncbi:MAG: response regulator [Alphaproteobacteria bacterium]|nr:response regulator [Alphaproteobacteria bacterium]
MALILVVDDDTAVRDSIQTLLGLDGHEVAEARDGRECEEAIGRRLPDLVILDIFMPERDGFETLRSLRRTHPRLKILAISGSAGGQLERTLAFAREFGADAVLDKPFPADALRRAVRALLAPDTREANG